MRKPDKFIVFFDFDNTIAANDTFDGLLPIYSKDERWIDLERDWQNGKIGSRECLCGQLKGMELKKKELDKYLSAVKLDPYFKRLLRFLQARRVKAIILSDNFDYLLHSVLRRHAIRNLKVYANKLRFRNDRPVPSFPFKSRKCKLCAHCKTKNLLKCIDGYSRTAYVGDGRSDICPAKYADIVFAKESLLDSYRNNNKAKCIPYNGLKDVYNYFKRSLR